MFIIVYNSSKLYLYNIKEKSSIKGIQFYEKNSFDYNELINCGNGQLFGPGNAKLPLPPMLMFDRITEINDNNGAFNKGSIKAELDIKDDLWFFDCHFKGDPVMPGCLGLDAMWQLVGFYLGWLGNPGKGRALGVGTVKFTGEVLQNVKMVKYVIDMKKIMSPGGTTVGLANGVVLADDKKIYFAESLKVGLFK
jgi:3-hydroxyacyl-[acyl-carrier protein] dehydratase/trans-2-decenoyl-[acyl-carrier protein] isomerase